MAGYKGCGRWVKYGLGAGLLFGLLRGRLGRVVGGGEEVLPGVLGDQHDGGVLDLPLNGDGVEGLLDVAGLTDHLDSVFAADFIGDDRRAGKDAESFTAKDLH